MSLYAEDLGLARQIGRGDGVAFRHFFDSVFPVVYRFSLRRLRGDDSAAEEVAQITLGRAMRKIHTYRGEAALMTWVLTICRREIANWSRQRMRHAPEVLLEDLDPVLRASLESLSAAEDGPERSAERAEVRSRVHRALDRLRARHRQALRWKYLEGHTVREIARRLKISEKAAESVLTRARLSFREAFLAQSGVP